MLSSIGQGHQLDKALGIYLVSIRDKEVYYLLNSSEQLFFSLQEQLRAAQQQMAQDQKQLQATGQLLQEKQQAQRQYLWDKRWGKQYWVQQLSGLEIGGDEHPFPEKLLDYMYRTCPITGQPLVEKPFFWVPATLNQQSIEVKTFGSVSPMSLIHTQQEKAFGSAYWLMIIEVLEEQWETLEIERLPKPYRLPTILEMGCYCLAHFAQPRKEALHVVCTGNKGALFMFKKEPQSTNVFTQPYTKEKRPTTRILVFEVTERNVVLAVKAEEGGAFK